MRICLLTRYFDYRNAGIGRVSCELRDRLIAKGHDVVPVSTNGESLQSYFKYTAWDIRKHIPANCDVYHAVTPMEGLWTPRKQTVVTYLDLILVTHPERAGAGLGYSTAKNMIGRLYFQWAAKRASRAAETVAISDMTRRYVHEMTGKLPHVIHLGIREDLKPLNTPSDTLRIGYLGQLDRRKRVHLLIDAFKAYPFPNSELCIAGTGRDGDTLRERARGDKRIKFMGFVPDSDLCSFYNSLDIFAFPTWIEGYGLPIVEAMACGKPVVVWDDAVLPEEIKGRCYTFTDTWTRTMHRIYERSQSIEDNLQFAKAHSWDRCMEQYEEIYKEIIKGGIV